MKKCVTLALFLLAVLSARAFTPINQWWIFTGNYSYLDDNLIPDLNLGSDAVSAIAEDGSGNIWIGVAGRGLRFYNGKKMMNPMVPKESIAYKADVLSLAFDSKNNLWIGTTEGLVKYDGTTWTNYGPEVTGIRAVKHIAVTATDKLYIAGMVTGPTELKGGGIAFFNGQGWSNFTKSNSGIPDDIVEDLLVDKDGHLWMTVGSKREGGLAKFDGKNWKTFTTANTALPTNTVRAIATNRSGKLWFATPKGIVIYDGTNWDTKAFSNGFGEKLLPYTSRSGNMIEALSLAVEDNGTIWLGTRNQGVYCFRKGGIRVYTMDKTPLSGNSVHQILIDKTDRKWFVTGSYNEQWAQDYVKRNPTPYISNAIGITAHKMYGKETDPKWTIYDNTNSEVDLGSVAAMIQDQKGTIWRTDNGGTLVALKDGKYSTYVAPGALTGLEKMCLSPDGKIYLNTTISGFKVFENGQFTNFAKHPNGGGVMGMTLDKDGHLWAGGGSGLSRFVNNEWETFNKKNGNLPSVIIWDVFKDSKGNLWAGTAKGLVKYDGVAWTILTDKEVQFPSEDIRAIAEGPDGRLWFGTKSGLSIFDGTNWTHIAKMESIKKNKITISSISIDKNGVAWMGTDLHGLLRYDGTTWTLYDKEHTGSLYDKVNAVLAAADGKVYVATEKYQFNDSDFGLPSQGPTEAIRADIHKKLIESDPKYMLTIIEP